MSSVLFFTQMKPSTVIDMLLIDFYLLEIKLSVVINMVIYCLYCKKKKNIKCN